jgi:hypothetical protein
LQYICIWNKNAKGENTMTGTATAERRDGRGGETIEGLFQPDILAPAQYFDGLMKEQVRAPERDLALAMLEDAVVCFQKYLKSTCEKEHYLFTETEEWVLSDDRDWVFSFLNLCDFLGLDPEFLRKGLLRWKDAALRGQDAVNSKSVGVVNDTSNEKMVQGRQTEDPDRRRHAGGQQTRRPRRRRARSADGLGLAVVRKTRAL